MSGLKHKLYSQSHLEKNIPLMTWLIEVAEEKIIEHRLLKKKFNSHEEFVVFTIIWLRVFKSIFKKLKEDSSTEVNILVDKYIKNLYLNQKDTYLGMTINAITRESEIPRSTVKRIVEKLMHKQLVKKNTKNLVIPTIKVRDAMKYYRQYIYKSHKRVNSIFEKLDLKNQYDENNII